MPENDTVTEPAAEPKVVTPPEGQVQPSEPQRDAADEPLREPGLRALQAERERADRLEAQIAQLGELAPVKEQFDALRAVFGDKGNEEQSPEDVVKSLQSRVDAMQHDTLVNTVARASGITEDDDVALLRDIKDEAQMRRLAERLKATEKPAAHTPDPGQGARPGEASTEDTEYQQFYPTRK